jgi:hypothetical protein
MREPSELYQMMQEPLPSISFQKRLGYRTSHREVVSLYKTINETVFDNVLHTPTIEVTSHCQKYWGICEATYEKIRFRNTHCNIRMMDKWFCKQWLIATLAHEMCHQYQWDIIGPIRLAEGKEPLLSHGPSFYIFRDTLALHGIRLKSHFGMRRWMKHQNFLKC